MIHGLDIWLEGVRPITLNRAYTINRHKTRETLQWEFDFERKILKHRQLFKDFKKLYDKKKHFIAIGYFWYTPLFYTADKTVNEKSVDWSNMAKIPDDCVFKLLGIDDSQACIGRVVKMPSPDSKYYLRLKIHLREFSEIHQMADKEFILS